MAEQHSIRYIDDLDGTELGDSRVKVDFSFEGKDYTLDLSEKNAGAFRETMSVYVNNAARVTGSRKSSGRKAAVRPSLAPSKDVREWARKNGYDVSDRGRIPTEIMDAYLAAK